MTDLKTTAEKRADEFATYVESLGHTYDRLADPAEGVFEVIVRGKYETLQVVVRQSTVASRSAVWAQRIDPDRNGGKGRRVTPGNIRTTARSIALAPIALKLEQGQAVRHTKTGALGVFARFDEGLAYVRFAGGDPWQLESVHPRWIETTDVAAVRRSIGYYEPGCPACAWHVDADAEGNCLPHLRTDGFDPSVCQGSGEPRFEREIPEGFVRADLLNGAGQPFGPDDTRSSAFVIDGTLYPAVTTDDDTDPDSKVRGALAAAGYTLARGTSLYDNFVNGCSQLLLVRAPIIDPTARQADHAQRAAEARQDVSSADCNTRAMNRALSDVLELDDLVSQGKLMAEQLALHLSLGGLKGVAFDGDSILHVRQGLDAYAGWLKLVALNAH